MKKILFFISVFFAFNVAIGQTLLTESFDGATFPPTGWTNLQVAGSGTTYVWSRVTTGTYPTCTTHSGAGMAKYYCFSYSNGSAAILASPAVDLTSVGSNLAVVTFWMYRDNGYTTTNDSVDVYVNNTVAIAGAVHLGKISRYIGFAPIEAANGWYKYTFDIPAAFNGATNYFVFKATSQYGNNIFIDDIAVKISAANDAGIVSIDAPGTTTTAGLHNVDVTIKNFGSANLNSANIAWSVNGIAQTPYVWGSNLATGATDGPLTIGSYNFTAGFSTVKAWSVNPNGVTDGDHTNDTTTKVVFVQGYASLPFIENFDGTWINKMGTRDVPSVYFANTPVSGTNSWRRNDDGTSAGWSGTSGAYSPAGASGTTHSARFHSYSATAGNTGVLDLCLNFTTSGTKILKFWYVNYTGDDSLGVYISHDGGTTYNFLQEFLTSANWAQQQITLGAATDANTIVRFKATSDFGDDDIGLDGVEVTIMQPNDAGVVSVNVPSTIIPGVTPVAVTIENFGYSLLTSATINWSVNGVIQSPYAYANGPGLPTNNTDGPITLGSYNFATTGFYSVKAWTKSPNGAIDGSNLNDTTTKIIFVQGFASLPYTENFDGNWINKFNTNDVPSLYWTNTPVTGNDSWRRDDDGATGAWTGLTYGGYTLTGASGSTHSARFHSYDAPDSTSGMFDLALNFSQPGPKILQYWYINTSGNDTLDIYLSTDNGTTFSHLQKDTTTTDWTQLTLPLGTSTSATTILRFKATSDYGLTDIGLDGVHVFIPTNNDVGVSEIIKPVSEMCGKLNDSVTVLVHNYGLVAQTSIPVIAHIITPGGPVTLTGTLNGPLAPNGTDTLYLGSLNTVIPFAYTITAYTDLATDNVFSNDTIISTFNVDFPLAIPHIEDFEGTTPLANWNTNFSVSSGHGNSSYVLYSNLWSSHLTATAIMTKKIGPVTANSYLSFDYRIINYTGGAATALGKDTIVFLLSPDCGDSYVLAYLIDSTTHVASTSMKHIVIPIGSLAGAEVIPAIYAQRGTTGDYYIDFDNIAISEPAVVNLGPDASFCAGHTHTLNAGTSPSGYTYTYSWGIVNDTVFATTQSVTIDSAATYDVVVNNGFGLLSTDSITLTIDPAISVSLGPDTTVCISYILNAGPGYDSYFWFNGQTTQSITVDTTGIGAGTYEFFVTVTKNACSASDTVEVTFTACVGNMENNNDININMVPNPTSGITSIVVNGLNKPADIAIYSLLGQLMYTDKIAGNSSTSLDLSSLPKGIYMVRIFNENTNALRKLIIQ